MSLGGRAVSILTEFRDFAVRGNVVDLAVGVIIGGAFGKIVSSLVADVVMPVVGVFLGSLARGFAGSLADLRACLRGFDVRGFGASKPVAPNAKPDGSDDPDGRQKNRRVEIVVGKK